jgi:UDP-glucose 4-epimerase
VIAVYADNSKARTLLGWEIQYGLDQMMDTAWRWQQKLQLEEQSHLN